MYETSDFKKGLFIEIDGVPFRVMDFQHVKPGKGNQFTRVKLRNMLNNNVLDKTLRSGEKVGEPNLEHRQMQYLYKDGSGFQFMDMESYEQTHIDPDTVADAKNYLIENLEIEVLYYDGRPIALDLPTFVKLKVAYTEPGVKGDTASGGGKPAEMETGLNVTVPFHIKMNEVLKIDTRDGKYVEKVK